MSAPDLEVTAEHLHDRLQAGDRPYLLDVREPWEHAIAHLPGSHLIPMNELPGRLSELPPDQEIVVYCHHGVRSLYATVFLQQHGHPLARSLRGGLDAWSVRIDPDLPRY